jgi:ankyrin repeat protein
LTGVGGKAKSEPQAKTLKFLEEASMARSYRFAAAAVLCTGLLAAPAWAQISIDFKKPILTAIEAGDAERVKQILLKGESANTVDTRGWPILITAVAAGFPDVVAVLVKGGANPEVPDNFGNTALLRAVESENTEIAEVLLKGGAKVDAQNRQGTSSLMIAARRGSIDLVDLLLRYKANVNRADYTGRTALSFARQANRQAVASMIQRAGGKE